MVENIQRIAIAVAVVLAALGAMRDWREEVPSVEGAYYTETQTGGEVEAAYIGVGSYEVAYAEYPAGDPLVEKFEVWYPEALESEQGRAWPIVVMANGTGVPASRYTALLRRLASWGFVVVGNEQQNAWSGAASADSLDLLVALNEDEDSVFYQKLDTERVGSAGHSQGAIGAINAVTRQENGWRYKAVYAASTPSSRYAAALNWEYDPSLLGTPLFLAAGTGLLDAGDTGAPETMEPKVAEEAQEISIAPLWSQEEIYAQVPAATPKLRARRAGADHAEMLYWGDGYMTAWFMYWLQGDEAAGRAFFGSDAELLRNPLWQDVEKNL